MHKRYHKENTVNCMHIYNCGFEFQYSAHVDTVKQCKVTMTGWHSSAVGMGRFWYRIIQR